MPPSLESSIVTRPDPQQIKKRPQARASADIAFARRGSEAGEGPVFTSEGVLDVDALHRLVEEAESVIEGRAYAEGPGEVFFGSTVITIGAGEDPRRLAEALESDARARQVVRDRVFRELARLLGPDTPAEFEVGMLVQVEGQMLRVEVDIEAPLGPSRQQTS